MLPDDALFEMFDFLLGYMANDFYSRAYEERRWIRLTHVCRRWRNVIFRSPRRLNLRLICTPKTPADDILEIWPPLPLVIHDIYNFRDRDKPPSITSGNIIAALKHKDHVCEISLECLPVKLEYIANSPAMQKPFPKLTAFRFGKFFGKLLRDNNVILPDSLLGGTAPRLRSLDLSGVAFLGLPKLLLSTTQLVDLCLYDSPPSGYIPPEVMATSLSALTSLENLRLIFRSPRLRPALESRGPHPHPLTHSTLPSLTEIQFKGTSEYLEQILARIDAPRLIKLDIKFFNQIIFDTPQLSQFISRIPSLRSPETGQIEFYSDATSVTFPPQTSDYGKLNVGVLCTTLEWQLSSLVEVCTKSLPSVCTLEDLYIHKYSYCERRWQDDDENTLWLELLHPFVVVKNLYLSKEIVLHIAPALQSLVGGRTTEVLPTLENIFLEGYQPSGHLYEGIEKFVAARGLTGHPVVVSRWDGVWEGLRKIYKS